MSTIKQLLSWVFETTGEAADLLPVYLSPAALQEGYLLGSLKFLHHFPTLLNSPPQLWEVQKMTRVDETHAATKVIHPHMLSHLLCEEDQKGTQALKYSQ